MVQRNRRAVLSFWEKVGSKVLNLEYKDKNAFGDGDTKDVYSYFLKELFRFRCAGIDATVPTSLTDEEAKKVGMIITHAYVQQNILPVGLAEAVVQMLFKSRCSSK